MVIDKTNRAGKSSTVLRLVMQTLACLPGMLVAYVLASLFHTQTVLAALSDLGVVVPLAERLGMSWFDVLGLWRYGFVIVVSMTLGFVIMAALTRRMSLPPWITLSFAGFVAFAAMLSAMEALISFTPIASARSATGFLLQCCAGGVGGAVAGMNLTIWKNFDSIESDVCVGGRS